MKSLGLLSVALLGSLLAGCMSSNLRQFQPIDQQAKTITVPPGGDGLTGELKSVLVQNGWKLVIRKGPSVTQGSTGEKTDLQQYDTFNTRYELIVNSNEYDYCLNSSPAVAYDIAVVDNQTGAESFTLSGRDCASSVGEQFSRAIQ